MVIAVAVGLAVPWSGTAAASEGVAPAGVTPTQGAVIRPVTGDWDGNGTDTVGTFIPSTRAWLLRNSNSSGGADVQFGYGGVGDVPRRGRLGRQRRPTPSACTARPPARGSCGTATAAARPTSASGTAAGATSPSSATGTATATTPSASTARRPVPGCCATATAAAGPTSSSGAANQLPRPDRGRLGRQRHRHRRVLRAARHQRLDAHEQPCRRDQRHQLRVRRKQRGPARDGRLGR